MSTPSLSELTVDADVPVPDGLSEDNVADLSLHVLRLEGADGAWTLGFRFVDDDEMQAMHRDFMGLDSPTDIMTFPLEGGDWAFGGEEAGDGHGGDIVISVDTAAAQATEG
ncbi:MAG: rRNA maturation RNase YbeY, partial [Thermomicrobiales bacterium]